MTPKRNSYGQLIDLALRIFLLLLVAAGISHNSSGVAEPRPAVQSNAAPSTDVTPIEANWENLPTSPLTFKISTNKRFLLLVNSSPKTVVKYQLACVIRHDGKLKLVKKLAARTLELEPEIGMVTSPIPSSDGEHEVCGTPPAKVVVWQVQFADGSDWKAFRKKRIIGGRPGETGDRRDVF